MNFTNVAAATALLCAVGAYAKVDPAEIIKQAKTLNDFTTLVNGKDKDKVKIDLKLSEDEVFALKNIDEADWNVQKVEEVLNNVPVNKAIKFIRDNDGTTLNDAKLKEHNMTIDQFNTLKDIVNLTPEEYRKVMDSSGGFFTTKNFLIGAGIVVAGLAVGGYFYMKKGDEETDL